MYYVTFSLIISTLSLSIDIANKLLVNHVYSMSIFTFFYSLIGNMTLQQIFRKYNFFFFQNMLFYEGRDLSNHCISTKDKLTINKSKVVSALWKTWYQWRKEVGPLGRGGGNLINGRLWEGMVANIEILGAQGKGQRLYDWLIREFYWGGWNTSCTTLYSTTDKNCVRGDGKPRLLFQKTNFALHLLEDGEKGEILTFFFL